MQKQEAKETQVGDTRMTWWWQDAKELHVNEQETTMEEGMEKAMIGAGMKLDQIDEEEFADRSSIDSDGEAEKQVILILGSRLVLEFWYDTPRPYIDATPA